MERNFVFVYHSSTAARLKRMCRCYSGHGERRVLYLSCCCSRGKKLVLPCNGNLVQPFHKKTCRCSLVQRNKICYPRFTLLPGHEKRIVLVNGKKSHDSSSQYSGLCLYDLRPHFALGQDKVFFSLYVALLRVLHLQTFFPSRAPYYTFISSLLHQLALPC